MLRVQKINNIVKITNSYSLAIKQKSVKVNLAGLEPLLWHEGHKYDIIDLIKELKAGDCLVEITTNGSLLAKFADSLITSGISKCRVSVHSFDNKVYNKITSKDNLNLVLNGIKYCKENNLNIVINRTLLNGHTDDLPKGLEFIQSENLTLKLYDLWWVKRIDKQYTKYYLHWSDIIEKYVKPITKSIEEKTTELHRNRTIYHLNNGGAVDVKQFSNVLHDKFPICKSCHFRSICRETFGSYIHVFPNGHLTFCNLREDIHLDLQPLLDKDINEIEFSEFLKLSFEELIGHSWLERLKEANLRFYINEICNYRCSFPDSNSGYNSLWCLSSVRTNETWDVNNFIPETKNNELLKDKNSSPYLLFQ